MRRAHRATSRYRFLCPLAPVLLTACIGGSTGPSQASIRFLMVQGAPGPGQQLVEYSAPPLVQVRSMPTDTGGFLTRPMLRDGTDGAFYAYRAPDGAFNPWTLVHYDASWHITASRSDTEVVDTTTVDPFAPLALTPSGQYLIASFYTLDAHQLRVVLDPATLAVVSRAQPALQPVLGNPLTAATGSEVVETSFSTGVCPTPVVWRDAASGMTTDSTSFPCAFRFAGALTKSQLYLWGSINGAPSRFVLYDATTQTIAAVADTIAPGLIAHAFRPASDILFFGQNSAAVWNAQSLAPIGRVATAIDSAGEGIVADAITDRATGTVVSLSEVLLRCPGICGPSLQNVLIIAPDRLATIVNDPVTVPSSLVH